MSATAPPVRRRLRLRVTGAVQGVGMRPFLYRTASELGLAGWIRNDTRGVILEMEGAEASLRTLEDRLRRTPPPRAVIQELASEWLAPAGELELVILPSDAAGEKRAVVLPDLATCPACLEDIGVRAVRAAAPGRADEAAAPDRRAGYAFTNCTDCGPRFSIIRALPYDRPNTTMAGFTLCPECRAEYENPLDRRFHAQPTACPSCGPHLRFEDGATAGAVTAAPEGDSVSDAAAIRAAAAAIRAGRVVAVKGLGGFHLVVDAGNEAAVARLRERKHRPTKPLAVMARDLAMARSFAEIGEESAALLSSPEAPIVLLPKRETPPEPGAASPVEAAPLAPGVAPGNPYVGVMLPYTPLHHLLLRELDGPVVATSGNVSDEPICTDDAEAADRLGGIADAFLFHDRPIERPVDDSVIQWIAGAPRPVRRARGYAPLPVTVPAELPPILAVGGHLKNTIALARGTDVFLSQHIGDLETPQARDAFERVIADFLELYEIEPGVIAHDQHPGYASTAWAVAAADRADGRRLVGVQHHHAHLASCLADNQVDGPALGVIWDGTGLGPDGEIWGGEFLLGDAAGYQRVAHLRPFRLPGGEAAVKEPRRMALALAHAAWGEVGVRGAMEASQDPGDGEPWDRGELRVLLRMLETGLRSPWTTSAGRLFDGVSALLGIRQRAGYEGEAAMALEYAVDRAEPGSYGLEVLSGDGPMVVDWTPALESLLEDRRTGAPVGVMAARFHNGLAAVIADVAERVGVERVALSGGCFQNTVLAEETARALERRGLKPLLHRRVPANDGGLALGQVAVAAAVMAAAV